MAAKAYLTDKLIHLVFDVPDILSGILKDSPASFKPGSAMTCFLRADTQKISGQYDKIIFKLIKITDGNVSADRENWLLGIFEAAKADCPYINYYTAVLVAALLSVIKGQPFDAKPIFKQFPDAAEMYERYKKKYEKSAANPEKVLAYYYAPEYIEACAERQRLVLMRSLYNILFIKETLIKDIERKKRALSKDLAFLYGAPFEDNLQEADEADNDDYDAEALDALDTLDALDSLDGVATIEKLALLEASKRREGKPFYFGRKTNVSYELVLVGGNVCVSDMSVITDEYLEENKVVACECFSVDTVGDLIAFEVLKVIENKTMIKRCENCGSLFVPAGRTDAIYCTSLFEATGKTCAETGAAIKFKDKAESNPVQDAYIKAYKRNDSRVRNEKMTKNEFKEWVSLAREKRAACIGGQISFDEFSQWLGNKK